MKRTFLLIIALAATAAIDAFAQERSYQRDFPVNSSARFSLDSYKGTISVRTDGGNTIRVKARIYPDVDGTPESIHDVEIRENSSRNSVSIKVRNVNNDSGNNILPLVHWDIRLPDTVDLALTTYKSQVDLDVPAGRIDINSYKGTGTIRGVRNAFKLDTYKGNFKIEVRELADLDLDTYKGDIALDVWGAEDFELRANTYKGTIQFTGLVIPVENKRRNTEVSFTRGSGRNRLSLETYKGSFKVDFK
ncbi:MAG: DUF4097 family beta strand repeat protein [Acidobacteria bacterium]|nr:DUF4097 family beta strand repeat protein [Acidobacteriota bacterium]